MGPRDSRTPASPWTRRAPSALSPALTGPCAVVCCPQNKLHTQSGHRRASSSQSACGTSFWYFVGTTAASFKGPDAAVADLARPQSNWTIRPFQRGDAPRARQLIESVWHEHFDRHPDPFVRNFIYSRLSDVDNAETIYGDQAIFLCAIAEAEIIGTGAIRGLDNRECEMARMFVASGYRGRGIGRPSQMN